jgi:hypothetical protein
MGRRTLAEITGWKAALGDWFRFLLCVEDVCVGVCHVDMRIDNRTK